ncbi:InlB B-repeat-containing protein [Butyrivibrio sp. AD3002]|uniref:InlB B-repeat-containing protein n=1 Tax=Butyrivibrio sp. AD3002 TaxID=1280670 RepID=UPI0003B30879|nr:InlB B-repeat-containing protein [Butyrivibrio sp. AD3002]
MGKGNSKWTFKHSYDAFVKSILKTCMLFIMCIFLMNMFNCTALAKENAVTIVTKRPMAGQPLEIKKSDVVNSVKWYIGDTVISEGDTYTPESEDYEKWIVLKAYDSEGKEVASDSIYFSKLPVVYINTDDGQAITDKNEKPANLFIQGNDGYSDQYSGKISVKLRGNTSAKFPQKPYKIKLDKSTDLFGMGKNKHWCLISNYIDQCAMRNVLGSEIAKQLGIENMDMTWVDVVLNGEYRGMYVLTEHISIGSTRVNIYDWEDEAESISKKIAKKEKFSDSDKKALEDLLSSDLTWVSTGTVEFKHKTYLINDYYDGDIFDISGGYLYELSEEFDEDSKFETSRGLKVMLKKPESLFSNDDMMNYSQEYWQNFEDALVADSGYNSQGKHYTDYADFDSMTSYWLTMEIMGNHDSSKKSRFCYLDKNGKIFFGPAWDFDWGCGSYTVGTDPIWWKLTGGTLWRDFVDDPYFQIKSAEKYWDNRDYFNNWIKTSGLYDEKIDYIKEAGRASDVVYPRKDYWIYERRDFDTDASLFRTYFSERLQWFDRAFANNQVLSKSLSDIKSSRGDSYKKQDEELPLDILGGSEDKISEHFPADYILGEKMSTTLSISGDAAEKDKNYDFEVYINGKYSGYAIEDETGYSFSIEPEALTEPVGKRNVIAVICRDKNGKLVYSNYKTVIQDENMTYPAYTITYNSNGGSEVAAQSYQCGMDIDEPEDPIKEGCIFTGWYLDEGWTTLFDFGEMPQHDITLYAGWHQITANKSSYVLYFVSNGGTTIPTIITENPSEIDISMIPEREGYSFGGWYSDKNFENEFVPDSLNEGLNTVYANWIPENHTISFDSCGGSVIDDSITGVYGSEIHAPAIPQRDGYWFVGWYKESSYENIFLFGKMPAEDITLYAKWTPRQYMLRYVTNGGSLIPYSMENYDAEISAPAEPTRLGYTFAGWYIDRALTQEFSFDRMPYGNTTLYAKWDRANYLVSYESNGGSEIDTNEVPFETYIPVPSVPEKEGYVFTGWFADEECQTPFGFGKMPAEDIVLYAGWTEYQNVVRFVTLCETAISPIISESDIIVEAPEEPSREGYTFAGWYADAGYETEFDFAEAITGVSTVYAKWDINAYSITYASLGGSEVEAITADYDAEIVAPEIVPEKEGFTFTGWFTDEACENEFSFGKMPANDLIIFAGWVPNNYTVTVDTNGGNEIGAFDVTYGQAISVAEPIREGYTFRGWFVDRDLSTAADLSSMPAYNLVLFAGWEKNNYTFEYDSMGGSPVEAQIVAFGENVIVPEKPVKEGYVFTGWYIDQECTALYPFGTMPAGNVKVYAGWAPENNSANSESAALVDASKLEIGKIYDTVDQNVKCKVTSVSEDGSAEGAFIYSKDSEEKTVTIPGRVVLDNGAVVNISSIDDNAFAKNTTITKVIISKNISKIGKKAFYGCKKLKKIVIKSSKLSKKSVGKKAFKGISSKATIQVPKNKVKKYEKVLRSKGVPEKAKIVGKK